MANKFIRGLNRLIRSEPREEISYFLGPEAYETMCGTTHRTVANDPDVNTGMNLISNLIASMTIKQMENQDKGPDKRIIDGISRIIDIAPCKGLTKQQWITRIVKNLILHGNAYVIPTYSEQRYLKELVPVKNSDVRIDKSESPYGIIVNGESFSYSEFLHFKINCGIDSYFGEGIKVTAKDVVEDLSRTGALTKEFMTNRFMPSVIIKVDTKHINMANKKGPVKKEDGSTVEGKNLAQKYIDQTSTGQPFVIPAGLLEVEQIKPMSLVDLAVNDNVKLSKSWIASILGIPSFLLGVGDFKQAEYNNMVSTTIMFYAKAIQDELTAKVLDSPRRYFKLNPASLYNYDLVQMGNLMSRLRTMGVTTGNEVREKVGMDPSDLDGMDDLIALENYIPVEDLGNQEKLKGGEDGEE